MAFKWDINLGHLLIATPMLITATAYLVTDHNAISNLTLSFSDMKANIKEQVAAIRTDIGNLPDVRAQASQIEKRVSNLEAHSQIQDTNVSDLSVRLGSVEYQIKQERVIRNPR